jgi:hypothetical protein
VRLALVVAVAWLGLTSPVTSWDRALLSESLSISLAVVLTALVVRCFAAPTRRVVVTTAVVGVVWALARQNNALVLGALGVLVLVVVVVVRPRRRLLAALGAAFVVTGLVGVVMATSETTIQRANTTQIIVRRLLPDASYRVWLFDHGLPRTEVVERYAEAGEPGDYGEIYRRFFALVTDPEFEAWLRRDGSSTYLRFVAAHPGYVVSTLFTDHDPVRGLMTGADVQESRSTLVDALDALWWPRSPVAQVLSGLALTALVGVIVTSRRRAGALPSGAGAAGCVIGAGVANLVLVTHSAGAEFARLLVGSGITGRLALVWLAAAAFDAATAPGGRRSALHSPTVGDGGL